MSNPDIRWQQRFKNYQKALSQMNKFMMREQLNELEEQGLIQSFEYTHELAWKTLGDFIKSKGKVDLFGSKDVTREAFQLSLIDDGDIWMEMILSRNLTSHTYNEETTKKIITAIRDHYHDAFLKLEQRLNELVQ